MENIIAGREYDTNTAVTFLAVGAVIGAVLTLWFAPPVSQQGERGRSEYEVASANSRR